LKIQARDSRRIGCRAVLTSKKSIRRDPKAEVERIRLRIKLPPLAFPVQLENEAARWTEGWIIIVWNIVESLAHTSTNVKSPPRGDNSQAVVEGHLTGHDTWRQLAVGPEKGEK
jgi:hypothetical protein